jgi:putative ABC transport system permease protein
MRAILRDVVHTWTSLGRRPLFTLLVIACLAVGLGASTAVSTVVNAELLRPLPYRQPARTMLLWDSHRSDGVQDPPVSVSPANYDAWRRSSHSFESLEAVQLTPYTLTRSGEPLLVLGAAVSAGFFPCLGIPPLVGRTLLPEEDRPGGPAVAILSFNLWKSRFGGSRSIVGKTIVLNQRAHAVIGVMPPELKFPPEVEVWTALGLDPLQLPDRNYHSLYVLGVLRPEVRAARARNELAAIARRLERDSPETNAGWGCVVTPLREWLIGDVRAFLLALAAAVACLLLITCANVSNLLLARAVSRMGEVAVRGALGAPRWHLVRQLMLESLSLAMAGGALGLLVAWWSTRTLLALAPTESFVLKDVGVDATVAGIALALSVLAGLLAGSLPALRTLSPNLFSLLRPGGGAAGQGRGGARLQRSLVVAEFAMVLPLLIGAGLMLRSLQSLWRIDPGFDPDHLLTFRLALAESQYPEIRDRAAFFDLVLARITALPGLREAGVATILPADSSRGLSYSFTVEGRPSAPGEVLVATSRLVSAGYLQTLRIPLRRGRFFAAHDYAAGAPGVVIVSERMARHYWPGIDPVGRRVKRGSSSSTKPWLTVVGVVGDVKDHGLTAEGTETWYLPYSQHLFSAASVAVRTSTHPLSRMADLRREIWRIDPEQPIVEVAEMHDLLAGSMAKQRFTSLLLSLFAGLGLMLAVSGIYGVMSYAVSQRSREIGMRQALGARPRDVLLLILRQGLLLALAGVLLGLLGALILGRLLASQLFGVGWSDPGTFAAAAGALTLAGLASCYLSARRAAAVDPRVVLRSE